MAGTIVFKPSHCVARAWHVSQSKHDPKREEKTLVINSVVLWCPEERCEVHPKRRAFPFFQRKEAFTVGEYISVGRLPNFNLQIPV